MDSTRPTTEDVGTLWQLAREEAKRFQHLYIRTEHLLLAMLRIPDSPAYVALTMAGLDYARLAEAVGQLACPVCAGDVRLVLSSGARQALAKAENLAGSAALHSGHILWGILQQASTGRRLLEQSGVALAQLEQDLERKFDHAK